jgi:hypothetical protein
MWRERMHAGGMQGLQQSASALTACFAQTPGNDGSQHHGVHHWLTRRSTLYPPLRAAIALSGFYCVPAKGSGMRSNT